MPVDTFDASTSVSTTPVAINASGEVVGNYTGRDGHYHNFTYTGAVVSFDASGSIYTAAAAINDSGEIAGVYADSQSYYYGFTYTSAGGTVSFAPTSGYDTNPVAINASGEVTGSFAERNGDSYVTRGFIYTSAGGAVGFSPSGSRLTQPLAINASGEVVGYYEDSDRHHHGFTYTAAGGAVSFDPSDSISTHPLAINASGEVVGYYEDSSQHYHGFTYTVDGGVVRFDASGSLYTFPAAINASGEVVGYYLDSDGNQHGFTYTSAGGAVSFDPSSSLYTVPVAINDSGEIVGTFTEMDGDNYVQHGFTYTSAGGAVSFDLTGSDNSINPIAINSSGEVVGDYQDGDGNFHGFVYAAFSTITGTVSGQTTSEAPVHPFSTVTIGDTNGGATDTLTITLSGAGGTLSGTGLTGSGTPASPYTLTGTAADVTSALDALSFTPTTGQANTQSTTTFALSDMSSAYRTPAIDSNTSVTDIDPAVAPTITGTSGGQTTSQETATHPFAQTTIADANAGATDTLTIMLSNSAGGTGGVLTDGAGYGGLSGSNGVYMLNGTATAVTSELRVLLFTPAAATPNSVSTTTFHLGDTSSASATVATDGATTVTDTAGNGAKSATLTYYPGTNIIKEYTQKGITGTSYNELDYVYAIDGSYLRQTLYAGAHVAIYDATYGPQPGAVVSNYFDGAGDVTRTDTVNADGSRDTRKYGASGASDDSFYDAANHYVRHDIYDTLTHRSGSLTYDGAGLLTSDTTYGSSTNVTFAVTYYSGTSTVKETIQNGITGTSYNALDYVYAQDGTPIHQTLYAGAHVPIYDMVFDPATGVRATSFFDASGNPAKTTTVYTNGTSDYRVYDGTGASTDFFYDAGNHLTKRLDFDTQTHTHAQYLYDAAGRITAETDYAAGSTNPAFFAAYYAGTSNPQHQDLFGITGKSYTALHLDYDTGNVLASETLDLTAGGYAKIAFGDNRTLTSAPDVYDTLQASGSSETYVFHAGMGEDTVTNFIGSGVGHDVAQFDAAMFAAGRADTADVLADYSTDVAATSGANAQPASVLLTFNGTNSVQLYGTTIATLQVNPRDFAFV